MPQETRQPSDPAAKLKLILGDLRGNTSVDANLEQSLGISHLSLFSAKRRPARTFAIFNARWVVGEINKIALAKHSQLLRRKAVCERSVISGQTPVPELSVRI